MVMLVFVML